MHTTSGSPLRTPRDSSRPILGNTDSYFREVARYVVLNPVRAEMRKTAGGYKWSSYRATAGLEKAPEWLDAVELLDSFDCFDREHARELYREFVAAGTTDHDLMHRVVSQLVLGSEAYIARVHELVGEKAKADREYTREQRFVGRPTIDVVVRAVATDCQVAPRAIHTGHGGLARMMTAGLAVDAGLARLTPVARTLGLRSPSRVSTLASQCRAEVELHPSPPRTPRPNPRRPLPEGHSAARRATTRSAARRRAVLIARPGSVSQA